jgi:transcriptional regulator GlxA family with amidase domain
MSSATFMRQFQDKLGRSATEMLTNFRMSRAADKLTKSAMRLTQSDTGPWRHFDARSPTRWK